MAPSEGRTRPPRPAVTGRALVLGTVVVLLLVLLASPLNRYFGSRGDVNSAAAAIACRTARGWPSCEPSNAQWGDPGYIERQARTRLQYAMPGDTTYIVVDRGARNQIDRTRTKPSDVADHGSWNTKLWDSVQRAGDAA